MKEDSSDESDNEDADDEDADNLEDYLDKSRQNQSKKQDPPDEIEKRNDGSDEEKSKDDSMFDLPSLAEGSDEDDLNDFPHSLVEGSNLEKSKVDNLRSDVEKQIPQYIFRQSKNLYPILVASTIKILNSMSLIQIPMLIPHRNLWICLTNPVLVEGGRMVNETSKAIQNIQANLKLSRTKVV
jgi:hypothetical protein